VQESSDQEKPEQESEQESEQEPEQQESEQEQESEQQESEQESEQEADSPEKGAEYLAGSPFKKCEMTVKSTGEEGWMQFSELLLYDQDHQPITKRRPSSDCKGPVETNLIDKAFDGNVSSKFLCKEPESTILIEFDEPTSVGGYEFFTANEHPGRDPTIWKLRCSSNDDEWEDLTSQTNRLQKKRHTSYGVHWFQSRDKVK
jgi:hypothetical protein